MKAFQFESTSFQIEPFDSGKDNLLRCALLERLGFEIAERQRADSAQNRTLTDPLTFMKQFIPDVHLNEAQSATNRGWLALR